MRQIEKINKKGVLRKLLIKLCRLLGYELIDQADMSFVTSLDQDKACLLYTSPSPRDRTRSRMPSSA